MDRSSLVRALHKVYPSLVLSAALMAASIGRSDKSSFEMYPPWRFDAPLQLPK